MNTSKEIILEQCNAIRKGTLMETLEIEYIDLDETTLTARMPVNSRVFQPDGVLHGGASVALAESVGSAAAIVFLRSKDIQLRGIEIAANHVKSVSSGYVYAKATAIHMGRTTQLWQVRITNETGDLVSLIKLTTLALSKS